MLAGKEIPASLIQASASALKSRRVSSVPPAGKSRHAIRTIAPPEGALRHQPFR
jgi:hypothetical protein